MGTDFKLRYSWSRGPSAFSQLFAQSASSLGNNPITGGLLLHSIHDGPKARNRMSSALEDYLSKLRELTKDTGVYAYRGQANSNWPVQSGAARRLISAYGDRVLGTPHFQRTYINYHINALIDPGRSKGFGVENGRKISDLELLAKLQHLGAATGLLDFTWSPLVALSIACQDQSTDGRVFLVNTLDTLTISKVTTKDVDQGIAHILSGDSTSPRLLYYEPMLTGDAEQRILRQRSVFIIGRDLSATKSDLIRNIKVSQTDKKEILADLTLLDYSYQSLFQDIYGFAEANQWEAPLAVSQVDRRQLGNRYYQDGEYSKAIDAYSQFATNHPNDYEAYFLRGNALAASGDYETASMDYSRAIALSAGSSHELLSHMFFYNRANAKSASGDLNGALDDYTEARSRDPGVEAVKYNLANTLYDLGQYRKAIAEYGVIEGHEVGAVNFNMGNALMHLGRFEEAKQCYERALIVSVEDQGLNQNLWVARKLIEALNGYHYRVRIEKDDYLQKQLVVHLISKVIPEHVAKLDPIVVGRRGNTGNYGGPGLRGGQGLEGELGFRVIVRKALSTG